MRKTAGEHRDLLRGAARIVATAGILVWGVALTSEDTWGASLYRCTDQSGASTFTDSPTQLEGCKAVESGTAALPETSSRQTFPASPRRGAPSTMSSAIPEVTAGQVGRAGQVTVPIQRVGHLLIVPIQVNGTRKARLILDTGASHTILSHEVSQDLGLLSAARSTSVTLKTAGGPVQAELVRVDSIRVAEAEVRNSLVAVYDMPDVPRGVDGLLGLSFLNQFQVTLDTARGELRLRRRDQ